MSDIWRPIEWLGALALIATLSACSAEPPLFLDWLSGTASTTARSEIDGFDAEGIVTNPSSAGFAPSVVTLNGQGTAVWMLRRRARLTLETFAPGPRELSLEAIPHSEAARFQILLDGEAVAEIEQTAAGLSRVEIPADRIRPGRHEIEIRLDRSMKPSLQLPGSVGTRAFGFAVRGLTLRSTAHSELTIRERWLPELDGSVFRLEGRASREDTRLWFMCDDGSGIWTTVREAAFDAGEPIAWEIALDGAPRSLRRCAVVQDGDIGWTVLGQRIPSGSLPARHNLLLISLDTTRRDALGVYRDLDGSALIGEAASPTPRLDELAASSTVYRRAYSPAPVTAPTHASLFLSQPPAEHGLRVNGLPLPPSSSESLVARLRAWGYESSAFVSLGVLAADAGFAQDFDHFDDELAAGWWRHGSDLNEALFRWLDGKGTTLDEASPRFLWLHYSDPHKPYAVADEKGYGIELSWDDRTVAEIGSVGKELRVPVALLPGEHRLRLAASEAARREANGRLLYEIVELDFGDPRIRCEPVAGVTAEGRMGEQADYAVTVPNGLTGETILTITVEDLASPREIRRRYLDEVMAMDASIGAALDRLDDEGWLADAVIAVVADHGEDLGAEDGRFGHVEHLGPTLSSIGMLIHDPRRPHRVVDEPVSVVDLAPTLLRAVGVDASSRSLGRDLFGEPLHSRPLFLESFPPEAERHWRALIMAGHKLEGVVDASGAPEENLRLYDLEVDPGCRRDLLAGGGAPASMSREGWGELLQLWSSWTGDAGAIPEVDPAMMERLRALGYVE